MSDTATLETVAQAVHDLAEGVSQMKAGMVDRETVERIAADVLAKQKEAIAAAPRGFEPQDEDSERLAAKFPKLDPASRIDLIHQRPAAWVATRTGRPVEDIRAYQQASDNLLILATALGKDPADTKFFQEDYIPALRAATDTATAAEGLEYVPRYLSSDLIERITLQLKVVALFPSITMPSNPFDVPGRGVSRIRAGSHPEQTADTGQTKIKTITPPTRKITLTAAKFAGEMITSKELEEDGLIAILPFMQEELVDFISADLEDTAINGDTAGTQDSDSGAALDPRLNWNGLRKVAIAGAKTDAANAAVTVAMLRTNRKNMGKYGVTPTNLAHIISINNYIQLLADPSVITMEKYGVLATILSGELGKADGAPLIVSEYSRVNLNATGVFDNVTTNRGVAITVNTRGFLIGERRGMTLQLLKELYSESDQDAIIATTRKAFSARFPTATEKVVALHYNTLT